MKNLMLQAVFLSAIFLCLMNTGCALLDSPDMQMPVDDGLVRFSDNQNILNTSNRSYRRMTRQQIEEEAELHAQAGSMWVMEGQGAYLFAQNKTRKEGDLLNVRIEGGAMKQVDTKVTVIRKLLKQLEDEEMKSKMQNETVPLAPVAEAAKEGERAPAGENAEKAIAEKVAEKPESDGPILSESVPTRITERLPDGNYRVKGQAPFMIGKREYRVIVTGMIRPEDYNDDGVSSNKLMDAQFDVVSIRKKESLQ